VESQQFAMFPRNDTHLTLQGLHFRDRHRLAVARCALPLKLVPHTASAIFQAACDLGRDSGLTVLHAREKVEE